MVLAFRTIVLVSVVVTIAGGCSYTFSKDEPIESIPVGTIKPELDYSGDVPDCETAAQRIEDNVQIGMTLEDVRRLVGRPRLVLPGSWWWTEGLTTGGSHPNVRYAFGSGGDSLPVSSISANASGC